VDHVCVSLERTHELELLVGSLETTMAKLGRGIDKLERDLFECVTRGLGLEGFAEGDDSLLGARDTTLEHDVILADDTVVGEASEGGDGFLGKIELGGRIILAFRGVCRLSDAIDLLVALRTMVITVLTRTGNCVAHATRMPCADTSNLAETFVSFAGKLGDTPTLDHALVSVTTSDADYVDHFVLGEHTVDGYGFLEETVCEVDFLGNGASVDLDLHDVRLLQADLDLANLGVNDGTNHSAVFLDTRELAVDSPSLIIGKTLGVFAEGLPLGAVPVLVKTTLDFLAQMRSPNGGKGAEALGSLDVTNQTNNDHGGDFKDGDRLQNFTLVHLGTQLIQIANNVGHASLVTQEGSDVGGFAWIILWERSDFSLVTTGSLAR